jgi:hypothetical protein
MDDFLSQNNLNEINIGIISGVFSALVLMLFGCIKKRIDFYFDEKKMVAFLKKEEEETRLRSTASYPVRIDRAITELKMSEERVQEVAVKSRKIKLRYYDDYKLELAKK